LPKPEKIKFVEDLNKRLTQADICIVVDFKGMKVAQINSLRRTLEKSGKIEMQVVKNTLACLASKGTLFEVMNDKLVGPNGLIVAFGDPVTPAKVLLDCTKDMPALKIKGAAMDGGWMNTDQLTAFSKLPGKKELQGMLAQVLAAPMRNLATALAAVPRGLATALAAVRDQKEKQAA
jgi:large subunit ribosomal protein L10